MNNKFWSGKKMKTVYTRISKIKIIDTFCILKIERFGYSEDNEQGNVKINYIPCTTKLLRSWFSE